MDLTDTIVPSLCEEQTVTRSPSSKIHSSEGGNMDPATEGCEASLNKPKIRLGAPVRFRDIECKSKFSRSSPWSKTRPREVYNPLH